MSECRLYNGDCLEVMKQIPDKSIDLVLCDLPYGTTACAWDSVIPFEPLWAQYRRVLKQNGVIALFGSEPFSSLLRVSNLDWYRYDWIWEKNNAGNFQLANEQPLKVHENISVFYDNTECKTFSDIITSNMERLGLSYGEVSELFLSKNGNRTGWLSNKISGRQFPTREQWAKLCGLFGIPDEYDKYEKSRHTYNLELADTFEACSNKGKGGTLNHIASEGKRDAYIQTKTGYPKSVLRFARETGLHPTQKPVALLEFLIRTYSNGDETVLDNCMGSGSTGVACMNTSRNFIGIELDEGYFAVAQRRIGEARKINSVKLF